MKALKGDKIKTRLKTNYIFSPSAHQTKRDADKFKVGSFALTISIGVHMKKITVMLVFVSSFAVTGCIEDLLSSLCERLASNNSIVASFATPNGFPTGLTARVTYSKTSGSQADPVILSECAGDFATPAGDKSVSGSGQISFLHILNDESNALFTTDGSALNETDLYKVTLEWFSDCEQEVAHQTYETDPAALTWTGAVGTLPPELGLIEECDITGESTVVSVTSEDLLPPN